MFLLFKISLLLVVLCLFVSFFCFWFVVLFLQYLDIGFVLLLFDLDLSFGFALELLLLIFVLLFIFLKNLVKFVFLLNLLNNFFFIFHLIFLFSFNVIILYCLDKFIKPSVISFSHFSQFTETGLFQLKLISVIFFNSLTLILMFNLKPCKFMRLLFFHSTNLFNFSIIFLFFNPLPFGDFEVPFINQTIVFGFGLSQKFVSFLFSIRILCFQLIKQFLLSDHFLLRIKELFWQIWNFNLIFWIFVLELVANKLTLFTDRKNIIIVKTDDHLIDSFGMGLNLINFFVKTQGISTVSDGTRLIFFIGAVHESFFTVEENDFGDIWVGENSAWSWDSVFDCVFFYWLSFLIFLSLWSDLDFINALVLVADWCIKGTTDVYCSLINQT